MTLPITPERLRAHVVRLAGEVGDRNVFRPAALEAAADYIVGQWRGFGYRVGRQEYQAKGVRCANLEVERRGREPAGGILLIGAHYVSVRGCPAANDNGSGVAALLELARRFAEVEPACTVRFVAFAHAAAGRGVSRRSDFPLEHTATFRWVPSVAWSDHRSFWRAGYPAVMITDTAFYRYRYYHTAADTPDKLTYDAFARATEGPS